MGKIRRMLKQKLCLLLAVTMVATMIPQTALPVYAAEMENEVLAETISENNISESISENQLVDSVSENKIEETSADEKLEDDLAVEQENVESEYVEEETVSENEIVESVSDNITEETVSENDIDESVSDNDIEETISGNDIGEEESVSQNDIENKVSSNDMESSVSDNELMESTSDNDILDSLSENDLTNDVTTVLDGNLIEQIDSTTGEEKIIKISVDEDAVVVSARIGAQAVDYENEEPIDTSSVTYKVKTNETITVTVTPRDNYKINSAVTKMNGVKDKNEKVKATGFTFSVKATADSVTEIATEALYKGQLLMADGEILAVKNVFAINGGTTYTAKVWYGNQYANIKNVTVEKNNSSSTKAEINQNSKEVQFNVDAVEAGNKKLKMNVTTEDDKVVTFGFSVYPKIQSITVKGVSRQNLNQTYDTTKEYKVTFKPSTIDISRIDVEAVDTNGAKTNDVTVQLNGNVLTVTTPAEIKNGAGDIRFYQKEISGDGRTEISGSEFHVNAVAPSILLKAKPTMKVVETTDATVMLNLSAPKNLETPIKGAHYYEIRILPDSTNRVPNEIAEAAAKTIYIKKTGLSQIETIMVNNKGIGNGQSWKYIIKASLVQLPENKNVEDITEQDANGANAHISKTAEIKATTLKPAYETKLSIKKGASQVYTGQESVVIGTPVFSKTTTYRTLKKEVDSETGDIKDKIYDITEHISEAEKLELSVVNGNIVAKVGSSTAIGKHTIIAYADAPEGSKEASATFTVNVVRGIEDITLVPDGNFIFKQYNKAVSINVKTIYNASVGSELPEPKTKKVAYAIVDKDGNEFSSDHPLYGMITVKNGKVTVNKNYVVSSNTAMNQFCVKVMAADYKDSSVCAYTSPIQIKTVSPELGEAVLVKESLQENGKYEVLSRGNEAIKIEEFNTSRFVVVKKGEEGKDVYTSEELVDNSELAFSFSNKTISIDADGTLNIEQTAKNITLTATTNDGSNKKISLSKLTLEFTETDELGVNISRGTYDYMGENPIFYTIGSPDSTTVSYNASKNEIFKLDVMYRDKEGNWQPITEDQCMNYTLSLKGAKQLSKIDNSYVITATDATAVITLTDKANSNAKSVYTLVNEAGANKNLYSLKVTTKDVLIGGRYDASQVITFEVVAGGDYKYEEDYNYKYAEIRVDAADAQKNKASYESLLIATADIDGHHMLTEETFITTDDEGNTIDEEKIYTFSVTIKDSIDMGSYKFNVTLGTVVDGDFIADTQTATVTLKTIEASKQKLTFTPVTTYSISTSNNVPFVLSATLNNEEAYYRFTGIHNVNTNGEVNRFTDYFEFTPYQPANGNEKAKPASVMLKQNTEAINLLTEEGKIHCVGFADYVVYDSNGGVFKKDSVKITVTVQKMSATTIDYTVLPIIKKDNIEDMFTTLTVEGMNTNMAHVYVPGNDFRWEPFGENAIKLMPNSVPGEREKRKRVEVYWLPNNSCIESELVKCQENIANDIDVESNIVRYEGLLKDYGLLCSKNVEFKTREEILGINPNRPNDRPRTYLEIKEVRVTQSNFVRETPIDSGYYRVPISYTKKAGVDIQFADITACKLSGKQEWMEMPYNAMVMEVMENDSMVLIVDKKEIVSLLENEGKPTKVRISVYYGDGHGQPNGEAETYEVTFNIANRKSC